MVGIVITLGERDCLLVDAVAAVAERARVPPEAVCRVDGLAARALEPGGGGLAALFDPAQEYVVGCSRPRAVRALLAYAGVDTQAVRAVWLALPFDRECLRAAPGTPWYPVIDPARCTGCGTCESYCLFSVYAAGPSEGAVEGRGGRVRVVSPLACKTGCPACARLCPESALLFPFCAEAALNGEVEEPVRRSSDALSEALGGDPMRMLAERRRRKGLIDPEAFRTAARERDAHVGSP